LSSDGVDTGAIRPKRSIGGLVADVVIEEVHNDELTITQHPVEKTSAITDHAFKNPVTLQVRIGYSPAGGGTDGQQSGTGDPVSLQSIYEQYRNLQEDRELLEVYTGKRFYDNMLIKSLGVTTDQDTENVLMIIMSLQEVILVETQTVTVPQNKVQAQPKKTANTLNSGVKQCVDPASFSGVNTDAIHAAVASGTGG